MYNTYPPPHFRCPSLYYGRYLWPRCHTLPFAFSKRLRRCPACRTAPTTCFFFISFSSISSDLFCQSSSSDPYHSHEHIAKLCASSRICLCTQTSLFPPQPHQCCWCLTQNTSLRMCSTVCDSTCPSLSPCCISSNNSFLVNLPLHGSWHPTCYHRHYALPHPSHPRRQTWAMARSHWTGMCWMWNVKIQLMHPLCTPALMLLVGWSCDFFKTYTSNKTYEIKDYRNKRRHLHI